MLIYNKSIKGDRAVTTNDLKYVRHSFTNKCMIMLNKLKIYFI